MLPVTKYSKCRGAPIWGKLYEFLIFKYRFVWLKPVLYTSHSVSLPRWSSSVTREAPIWILFIMKISAITNLQEYIPLYNWQCSDMSQFVNHRRHNLKIKVDHALFFNNTELFFCHIKWICSFSSLLFRFPLPMFFFLLTVAYLSLGGGTSCPRPACQCIPLITGCWDSVVQPA